MSLSGTKTPGNFPTMGVSRSAAENAEYKHTGISHQCFYLLGVWYGVISLSCSFLPVDSRTQEILRTTFGVLAGIEGNSYEGFFCN